MNESQRQWVNLVSETNLNMVLAINDDDTKRILEFVNKQRLVLMHFARALSDENSVETPIVLNEFDSSIDDLKYLKEAFIARRLGRKQAFENGDFCCHHCDYDDLVESTISSLHKAIPAIERACTSEADESMNIDLADKPKDSPSAIPQERIDAAAQSRANGVTERLMLKKAMQCHLCNPGGQQKESV